MEGINRGNGDLIVCFGCEKPLFRKRGNVISFFRHNRGEYSGWEAEAQYPGDLPFRVRCKNCGKVQYLATVRSLYGVTYTVRRRPVDDGALTGTVTAQY